MVLLPLHRPAGRTWPLALACVNQTGFDRARPEPNSFSSTPLPRAFSSAKLRVAQHARIRKNGHPRLCDWHSSGRKAPVRLTCVCYSMRAALSRLDRWWQLSRADSSFHSPWEQTSGGQGARRPSRWTILIRPGRPGNPTPVLCEGSHRKSDERPASSSFSGSQAHRHAIGRVARNLTSPAVRSQIPMVQQ